MTPYDALRKLVELAGKATPGPWRSLQYAIYGNCTPTGREGNIAVSHNNGRPNALADAEFITAARNAIPALQELLKGQEPAKPVAWRAWANPVAGKRWPSDQWVYWDEEPTTIKDDPEYGPVQPLYSQASPSVDVEAAPLKQIEELAGIALGSMVKGPDEDGEHWCGICDAMLDDELSGHKGDCASRVLSDIFDVASRKHLSPQAPKEREAEIEVVLKLRQVIEGWRKVADGWEEEADPREADFNACADELEEFLQWYHVPQRQPLGSPDGWVMVPKEPTDEQLLMMLRAFHADKPDVLEEVMDMSDLSDVQAKHLRDGYAAVLAAAPPAGSK